MSINDAIDWYCSHPCTPCEEQPPCPVKHTCRCGATWFCPLCGLRNPAFSMCCCTPKGDHNHDMTLPNQHTTSIPKPRCEDIGFVHVWEDITKTVPYVADGTVVRPELRRRCLNCNRVEEWAVVRPEIREWQVIISGR